MKPKTPMHRAFTLIELLVVVAVIAVLAIVVLLLINPQEYFKQARDSTRLNDMSTFETSLSLYAEDVGSVGLGNASTVYVSVPDPLATSTAGDQCQGLGLSALPVSWTYQCATSSTFKRIDGTGWIPVNLQKISSGAPIGAYPVDPLNQTSTFAYYTYVTNGSQYQIYAHLESEKYQGQETDTGGSDLASYKIGSNINIAPFAGGMVGYWPFSEGSGATTADASGYGNTGTLIGGTTWSTGPEGGAVTLDGSTGYVQLANNLSSTIVNPAGLTICAWVNFQSGVGAATYYQIFNDSPLGFSLTWNNGWPANLFAGSFTDDFSPAAGTPIKSISVNVWHEICAVQSGTGNATLYVDGSQAGAANQAVGAPTAPSYSHVALGATNNNGAKTDYFNGSIGAVRIYQRMLSSQEISGLY